ncbi:hypothetical protein, partial [Pseudomonas syringae group genomosp. 7]|uniref:hypothetical protein n=1 Tax=Pseudomonas syringae group genomosp. 7 TaxID=251699 RepID=UPI00376F5A78
LGCVLVFVGVVGAGVDVLVFLGFVELVVGWGAFGLGCCCGGWGWWGCVGFSLLAGFGFGCGVALLAQF